MVAHIGTISRCALEASSSKEVLIRWASMGYIGAFPVDTVDEEFDGSHVIASQKNSRCFLNSVLYKCQGDERPTFLRQSTSWLFFAVVGIEVQMATWLRHSVAGNLEKEETSSVCVDHIHKLGIRLIKSNRRTHPLKIWFSWIETWNKELFIYIKYLIKKD